MMYIQVTVLGSLSSWLLYYLCFRYGTLVSSLLSCASPLLCSEKFYPTTPIFWWAAL